MKQHSFFNDLMHGLTASASLYTAPRYRRRAQASDLQRLRGDMLRISGDFQTVMNREYGKQAARTQQRD
jgi:hypothetical protein